jgi:response regulator RpfG family c-di-GMP phosphodiesterase
LAKKLDLPDIWKVETAAMLSQIGCIAMPESIIIKLQEGRKLDEKEAIHFQSHPGIAADLISHIPRLEEVAEIVACQDYYFDGKGQPENKRQGTDIPIGARILKVVLDFDLVESKGLDKSKIIDTLNRQCDRYDPVVLDAFKDILGIDSRHVLETIRLNELEAGMILHDGLETATGRLLISRGQEITPVMIRRLKNYADNTDLKEPFQVLVLENVWDEKI